MNDVRSTDLRTPIARARGLGSGKTGTEHFWVQRITAVALALLVPWLVGLLVSMVRAAIWRSEAVSMRWSVIWIRLARRWALPVMTRLAP